MNSNEVENLLDHFNEMVDYLILELQKTDLDEHSVVILSKITGIFLSFTQKTFLKSLFYILNKFSFVKNYLNDEIVLADKLILEVTDCIKYVLNNILSDNVPEDKQKDLRLLVKELVLLKGLVNSLSRIVILVLKFQSGSINESKFRENYKDFKKELIRSRNTFNTVENPSI